MRHVKIDFHGIKCYTDFEIQQSNLVSNHLPEPIRSLLYAVRAIGNLAREGRALGSAIQPHRGDASNSRYSEKGCSSLS